MDRVGSARQIYSITMKAVFWRMGWVAVCWAVSGCASSGGGAAASGTGAAAAVKVRLRQPVPVIIMGLQDQVSFAKPMSFHESWVQKEVNRNKFLGDGVNAARNSGEALFLVLTPVLAAGAAAGAVMPLQAALTYSAAWNGEGVQAASKKMRNRAPDRLWGEVVEAAVRQQWAARGAAFSEVRRSEASLQWLQGNPLAREELARLGGRSVLVLHVVGPSLQGQEKGRGERLAASLKIYWRVLDTASGEEVGGGSVEERSAVERTLPEWAAGGVGELRGELDGVIARAPARLAKELR